MHKGNQYVSEDGAQIWQGVNKHLQADALFHNSIFFKDTTKKIRKILEAKQLGHAQTRLFFVAHVTLELMLDRLILINYPQTGDAFYSDLESVNPKSIEMALLEGAVQEYGSFFEMFDRFKQSRYLFHYKEDEKLQFAINRILMRANQQMIPDEKLADFHTALLETENLVNLTFEDFLKEMDDKNNLRKM